MRIPGHIRTKPMKRVVKPTMARRMPATDSAEATVERLQNRVAELEERLAALESVLRVDSMDVEISAPGRVVIQAGSSVEVQASRVSMAAGLSETSAGITKFTGMVQCGTLVTDTVVAKVYTPGAGNIW